MKEEDIRPKNLRDEFLRLSKEDITLFFGKEKKRTDLNCPACCETTELDFQFKKHGFTYVECAVCQSLFVNPRPAEEDINNFYTFSKAAKYWSTHLFKETQDSRRIHIFAPKAKMVVEWITEITDISNNQNNMTMLDVGMGYGIFSEEIRKLNYFDSIVGIEPSPSLSKVLKEKGFQVIETSIEEAPTPTNKFSVVVSFEVIEHVFSPEKFIKAISKQLKDGGYLVLTTLNINGFELLNLWNKSESIYPPHHINFFNLESLSLLLENCGFKVLKRNTPGELDVDIVSSHIEKMPINRFIEFLTTKTSNKVKTNFQNFLQKNNLSSHMWILAQYNHK
jgi:2-polyprenyl-3-methyl-5-hydroxy-6-metoxy-1,4-benzoquinol methylase